MGFYFRRTPKETGTKRLSYPRHSWKQHPTAIHRNGPTAGSMPWRELNAGDDMGDRSLLTSISIDAPCEQTNIPRGWLEWHTSLIESNWTYKRNKMKLSNGTG